jgi:TM2 domain-containing membrane protein YozV
MAAGILGILLGQFGVHKFVLGLPVPGAIMLVVSLVGFVGCVTGMFCFFPFVLCLGNLARSVIGLVEGIMYLSQTDADFYQRYAVEKRGWF